ncbi:hypothetical protein D9M70_329650 [compost metagenome]
MADDYTDTPDAACAGDPDLGACGRQAVTARVGVIVDHADDGLGLAKLGHAVGGVEQLSGFTARSFQAHHDVGDVGVGLDVIEGQHQVLVADRRSTADRLYSAGDQWPGNLDHSNMANLLQDLPGFATLPRVNTASQPSLDEGFGHARLDQQGSIDDAGVDLRHQGATLTATEQPRQQIGRFRHWVLQNEEGPHWAGLGITRRPWFGQDRGCTPAPSRARAGYRRHSARRSPRRRSRALLLQRRENQGRP